MVVVVVVVIGEGGVYGSHGSTRLYSSTSVFLLPSRLFRFSNLALLLYPTSAFCVTNAAVRCVYVFLCVFPFVFYACTGVGE